MIKSFKHKGLERYFIHADRRSLDAIHIDRIRRLLDILDKAEKPEELNLPGWGLHKLTDKRKGTWSLKVSGNWRLTFRFESGDAFDVNLEDYH